MKKIRWIYGFYGFGFGVWRNVMPYNQVIWTVCLGPLSVYFSRS